VLPHLVHRIRQKKLLRKAYKHKLYALCKLSRGYDRFSKLFAYIRKSEYRSTVKAWEKAYIFLLDEAMKMDKIGLISTNLAEKLAMTVT